MRVIAPIPKQFEDSNGVPYANGKVTVYLHNSTSLARIYKEAEGGTLAPNPTILDSHGAWNAFVNGGTAYDYVVQDEHDNVIFSYSNVKAYDGGGTTYTAGNGISISEENEIAVKTDNSTIHVNSSGELEVIGGGMQPSILVAQSDTMEGDDDTESQDFTFSQIEKVGDDIYIDDNDEIRLKKGIYHVSLVITFNVNSTEESRPWIEEVTFNYPLGYSGTLLDRSIRWPHGGSSNISVDFDYVVNADDTKLAMWLNSLGDEAYAKMKPISIHKIAEVE